MYILGYEVFNESLFALPGATLLEKTYPTFPSCPWLEVGLYAQLNLHFEILSDLDLIGFACAAVRPHDDKHWCAEEKGDTHYFLTTSSLLGNVNS